MAKKCFEEENLRSLTVGRDELYAMFQMSEKKWTFNSIVTMTNFAFGTALPTRMGMWGITRKWSGKCPWRIFKTEDIISYRIYKCCCFGLRSDLSFLYALQWGEDCEIYRNYFQFWWCSKKACAYIIPLTVMAWWRFFFQTFPSKNYKKLFF